MPTEIYVTAWVIGIVIALAIISQAFIITPPKTYKFVVFLGKYWFTVSEGISLKIPFLSWVDKETYVGVQEEVVHLSLKTKDQVTFKISLKVLYNVREDFQEAFKAMYNLEKYNEQIKSITTDCAIPVANGIELESVFDAKEKITTKAEEELSKFFIEFGIVIKKVLSDEPKLPEDVERQANQVIAAKRGQDAAKYKAEAIRVEKVGEAEADGVSVKIRMENLGKARSQYAENAANAIRLLTDAGVSAHDAIIFLSQVGKDDALVSAARHGNTIVVSQGGNDNSNAVPLSLLASLNKETDK